MLRRRRSGPAGSVENHAPGQRSGDEDPAVRRGDAPEVCVWLEGRHETVSAKGQHASPYPEPAFVLADALPDQPGSTDLRERSHDEQRDLRVSTRASAGWPLWAVQR